MVECEFFFNKAFSTSTAVLIDTWWNVNVSAAGQAGEWEDSFNRYMVECEFCKIEDWNINITVLIDTWWNVNLFRMIYKISAF